LVVPVPFLVARRLEILQRDQNFLRVLDGLRGGVHESGEPVVPSRPRRRDRERQGERGGSQNAWNLSHGSCPSSLLSPMSQKRTSYSLEARKISVSRFWSAPDSASERWSRMSRSQPA